MGHAEKASRIHCLMDRAISISKRPNGETKPCSRRGVRSTLYMYVCLSLMYEVVM